MTTFDQRVQQGLAMLRAAETVKQTGGAVEINSVKIQPCDDRGLTAEDYAYHGRHLKTFTPSGSPTCPVCGKEFGRAFDADAYPPEGKRSFDVAQALNEGWLPPADQTTTHTSSTPFGDFEVTTFVKKKTRLYISGTISSDPNLSFEEAKQQFDDARDLLDSLGYDAVSPTDMEGECGRSPAECVAEQKKAMPGQGQGNHSWECYLKGDIRAMMTCDGVALLPNWHLSSGAFLEVQTAKGVGLPCRTVEEWAADMTPFVSIDPGKDHDTMVTGLLDDNGTLTITGVLRIPVSNGGNVVFDGDGIHYEFPTDKETASQPSKAKEYCARCGAAEENHAPGGSRFGCDFLGAGTKDKCVECGETITWNGRAWVDEAATGGFHAACAGSTRPDVKHIPAGTGEQR